MKNILRILALAIALCMTMGFACAEAPAQPEATAHKANNIVIDGDLSDWNLDSPMILKDPLQLVRDGHFWKGEDDLSGNIYAAWDETYLYIAAMVNEDTPFGAIETLPIDGVDNVTLYISTNPADDPARTEYANRDFKVTLVMDGEYFDTAVDRSMIKDKNVRGRYVSKGVDGGEQVLDGYEPAAVQTTTGYCFEARIPWSCFAETQRNTVALYTPAAGDVLNFNVLLTDIDYPCPGTEYIPQISWTGNPYADVSPAAWGRLTLAE